MPPARLEDAARRQESMFTTIQQYRVKLGQADQAMRVA